LAEFESLANALGRSLQSGDAVFLGGPIGAGKTTFVRAMAASMGLERPHRVASPTYSLFVLHRGRLPLLHGDLFRLTGDAGAAPTALLEAFEAIATVEDVWQGLSGSSGEEPAGVLAVEWGELWRGPEFDHLSVAVQGEGDRRTVVVEPRGRRSEALLALWLDRVRTGT